MASLASAIKTASWIAGAALAVAGSCSGNVEAPDEAERSDAEARSTPPGASVAIAEHVPTDPPERRSRGPHLVLPTVIDIPYVVAGKGSVTASVPLTNDGDAELTGLSWTLSGDPSISLGTAPASLAPGETAELSLTWAGSAAEAIVQASLTMAMAGAAADIPIFAVAGDPGLGAAAWDDVEGAGSVNAGAGTTVAMPAAPYPDGVALFTDPSVRVFLPEGYRDRGTQDLVVHFHGWNTTLSATLASHLYQQHLYASGSNAVLVVPQGPVEAPSGDFGKLMTRGGLSRLITEVLVLLYREGRITHPVRGDLAITAHSGGYQAVAASLDPMNLVPKVAQVNLFDSLYGYESLFEAFALGGGFLRSNYTDNGGTFDSNYGMYIYFTQRGVKLGIEPTPRALRADEPMLHFAPTSHVGTTRLGGAYGEYLRWKLRHSRHGPRIELREVVAGHAGRDPHDPGGGVATVRWLAPADEDVTGFVVETSTDGSTWTAAATVAATAGEASFPLVAGARVRVKPVVNGVDPRAALPSDTYRVDPGAAVLVVDGFDRVLDGAFGGLQHDLAARVGEAVGSAAAISHRAVVEDGFDLTAWPAVVWLLGDASTADVSLSAAEQTALLDYVNGGGHLVMSGSELGFDVGQTPGGAAFLAHGFGAAYLADDAGSHEVAGHGPLGEIASFVIGGPGAPYVAVSPDSFEATEGGTVLLEYGSGYAAAVGRPGKSALVGFPLKLVDARDLGAVVKALVAFAGGAAAKGTP